MSVATEVRFNSRGEQCAGTLFMPDGDSRVPAVVLAHGFTATRKDGLVAFAERFADEGFAALTFDYRGFGESDGNERQVLSIKRELQDVAAAIHFLGTREDVDPNRIALWGSSLGGGLTFETAATNPAVACAIAQVPFSDGFSLLGAIPPAAATRLTAEAIKDKVAAGLGKPRVMIPAAGPPGSLAAMTSEDALPGFQSITPPDSHHQNRVSAGVALDILSWRPGRRAREILCPLLVQVADRDLDTPPCPALKAARSAPDCEIRQYDCGHFGVYNEPWFEKVVADQVDFLKRRL